MLHVGYRSEWWIFSGWFWMIVFWALVIWAITRLLARDDRSASRSTGREPDPIEILERRYARGELTDEQFDAKRSRLRHPRPESERRTPSDVGSARA